MYPEKGLESKCVFLFGCPSTDRVPTGSCSVGKELIVGYHEARKYRDNGGGKPAIVKQNEPLSVTTMEKGSDAV